MKGAETKLYRLVLGAVIKRLREKQGVTQDELAESLGVSQAHVSRIESGTRTPDAFEYTDIARTFGYTADWFQRLLDDIVDSVKRSAQAVAPGKHPADLPGHEGLVRFVVAARI